MKKILYIIIAGLLSVNLVAQDDLSPSNWKMTQAKMLFDDNKIVDALEIYRGFARDFPDDSYLNLRMADCYKSLMQYDSAIFCLNASMKNMSTESWKDEVYLMSGKIYHISEDFDKANSYYSKIDFKNSLIDSLFVKKMMQQTENAKNTYLNPMNYILKNAGGTINTEFNEFYPVFSSAEEKLYFSSDRMITDNQERCHKTNNYPISVFQSYINDEKKYLEPEIVDETFASGKDFILNSVSYFDEEYFLFKPTAIEADPGDIYIDTKDTDEEFTDPEKDYSGLNSIYFDASASYDYINDKIFLVSTRKDKFKEKSEIFSGIRFKGNFPNPDLITALNLKYNQPFVYILPGGDFLVYASDCDKSIGGYDLFYSVYENGRWSTPQNFGYPINSTADEMQFCVSTDGKTAYIASNRTGGHGGLDIYTVNLEAFFVDKLGGIPSICKVYGQVINEDLEGIETTLSVSRLSNPKAKKRINTSNDGYFSFALRTGEKYVVEINQKSFLPFIGEFDLQNPEILEVEKDLNLKSK